MMQYQPQNFDHLLGLPGFSDTMLKNHLTLYQGYITNVNKLSAELDLLVSEGKTASPAYAELKRRMGWEFNGMRLHELYFGGLTKNPGTLAPNPDSDFAKKLNENFGSFENWQKDFKATATMRGIGWVILYSDPTTKKLFNAWITEHDIGHFAGCEPLLVLDVFEHAYLTDYGLKRADYIEAFFKAADWSKKA